MKTILTFLSILLIALVAPGCHDLLHHPDNDPPPAPTGLRTATGDNFIELYWHEDRDPDVAGYNVYVSSTYGGRYEYAGTVHNAYYMDEEARNGVLYYYAVSAYDYDGNESELSNDVAYDIPRPEGYDVLLYNAGVASAQAGYDFSKYSVVPIDDQYADMYFVTGTSGPVMRVDDDTDIQDLGATSSILDISQAPLTGWSTLHEVPLVANHTYVVWTWDDHYAKFRVASISSGRVVFDWAYQLVPSNRLLKKAPTGGVTASDAVDFQSGMVYFFASLQEGRNVFSIMLLILMVDLWSPGVPPAGQAEGTGAPPYGAPAQLRRSLLPSRGKESVAAGSREVFAAVEQGLASGNVETVSAHLDSRVYMQLRGSEGGYHSSTQAYYILSAFLKARKPASVVFTTYGETDGAPYATGAGAFITRGVREDLQIYVALHLSGDRWVITHLNMY